MPSSTEHESTSQKVHVSPLTRFNWELVLGLDLHDYQEEYLPPVIYTLAQSKFEDMDPYGIFLNNELVGMMTIARLGGVHWVNRIMVDKDFQEKGVGTKAMEQMLRKLLQTPSCHEIRTSFMRSNAFAEYFFSKLGFQKIGDGLDDEIVMRYRPAGAE